MYNKLSSAISHQQVSCLCLLDISAAFDTIDHNILLKNCLPGSVLLTRLSSGFSPIFLLALSLSQNIESIIPIMPSHLWCSARFSSRAPILSIIYTTPLSSLIKVNSIDHRLHADDTQLVISFSPNRFSESINNLLHVVKQISSWMTSNLLCLNPSKTEFILIGLREQLKNIPDPPIFLNFYLGWVRRVLGTIWNVDAGDPSSLTVRNVNSGKPLKLQPLLVLTR